MHIRLGHSPDPDDAFMFYGLASGKVDSGRYQIEHILEDIQTLNRRALNGELEITALSVHAYAYVRDKYVLTRCGGSFGRDYGPMIVARDLFDIIQIPHKTLAVPGEMTTAFLLLRLICKEPHYEVVRFDEIIPAVQAGAVDAGLIIHEGQLTYRQAGLECVMDLGKWWQLQTHLPLPLGVNAVRRDLGDTVCRELTDILLASIQYGLDHRAEAVEYALQFARDMEHDLADKFVGMYVNDLTVDAGPAGHKAIDELLRRGAQAGIIPNSLPVEWV
jgi:1,4-dihydroxy-6-naphthoate synthase